MLSQTVAKFATVQQNEKNWLNVKLNLVIWMKMNPVVSILETTEK